MYLAGRIDQPPLRGIEVVVGEGLGHRIHAGVAADAVVEKDPAVAARAPRYVLTDPVGDAAGVQHLFHVAAQVVDHREAEHGAVGAGLEEGRSCGACGQDSGRGRIRQAAHGGLGRGSQALLQIDVLVFKRLVMVVVGWRVGRYSGPRADVNEVCREQGIEGHIVAHHADHGGGVIVERYENALFLIGPGRNEILECHVVEGTVIHCQLRGSGGVATGDIGPHVFQYGRVGRYAREPLVHAPGLLARPRDGRLAQDRQHCNCSQPA